LHYFFFVKQQDKRNVPVSLVKQQDKRNVPASPPCLPLRWSLRIIDFGIDNL